MAHVRAASPGSTISESNCHPYGFGRFSFMHNGQIAHFSDIKLPLLSMLSPRVRKHVIRGTTDSEHAFALFVQCLPHGDAYKRYTKDVVSSALIRTIQIILNLVEEYETRNHLPHTASSLNFCVTNGSIVVATRFRDSLDEEPPSLYFSGGSGFTFHEDNDTWTFSDRITKDRSVRTSAVVASEPLTSNLEDWRSLEKNHLLVVTGRKRFIVSSILEDSPSSPSQRTTKSAPGERDGSMIQVVDYIASTSKKRDATNVGESDDESDLFSAKVPLPNALLKRRCSIKKSISFASTRELRQGEFCRRGGGDGVMVATKRSAIDGQEEGSTAAMMATWSPPTANITHFKATSRGTMCLVHACIAAVLIAYVLIFWRDALGMIR